MSKLNDTTITDLSVPNNIDKAKPHILVVDDEISICKLLSEILTDSGYDVTVSEDPRDAIIKLSEKNFNLILSDINMPGMSGKELLNYCRHYFPKIRVILITGQPGLEDAIETVKDGAFDYIPKPIGIKKLLDSVEKALKAELPKHDTLKTDILPNKEYKIIKTLGAGSMGVVLLVEKEGCNYAMKILRRETNTPLSKTKRKRFFREAEIMKAISHPNIVKVYDFGFTEEDDVPYFIMEYVSGRSLREFIDNIKISNDEKTEIIKQVLEALDTVHEAGILHRDVKPENIIITEDNTAKLTDFGIARIEASNLTFTLELLGTPAYMAPESFTNSIKKDQRSDIFSVGVIYYELLTGVKPFSGETIEEMMESVQNDLPVEPCKIAQNLDPHIQDVLGKMLAKNPKERFKSATEVIKALNMTDTFSSKKTGITTKILRSLFTHTSPWRK